MLSFLYLIVISFLVWKEREVVFYNNNKQNRAKKTRRADRISSPLISTACFGRRLLLHLRLIQRNRGTDWRRTSKHTIHVYSKNSYWINRDSVYSVLVIWINEWINWLYKCYSVPNFIHNMTKYWQFLGMLPVLQLVVTTGKPALVVSDESKLWQNNATVWSRWQIYSL